MLSGNPAALVVAGGTDLMVDVNEGHRPIGRDDVVVGINRIPELRSWTLDRVAGSLRLGAAVTYAELAAPPLAGIVPALAQAARTVGSPQIRNAATIGGNVVTCSPAGDGLPVLSAADAVVELASVDGVRQLSIDEFMVGVKRTARRPDELLTAVTVPLLDGWQGYTKVGVRNAMVIAISGACLAVDEPSRSVRIALGSVAPTIVRASAAEAFVVEAIDWEGAFDRGRCGGRVRPLGGGGEQPDRRPPVDGGIPPTLDRRPRPTFAAPGIHGQWFGSDPRVSEQYRLRVNGVDHDVADAWLGESLLYVLRERLGLYGAKGACEQGECGSCSVLVDGQLVCACLVLAGVAVDVPIVTIEGIGDAAGPTDVQRAFVDAGAVQCGFCTPGLVMAAHDLLARIAEPTPIEIAEELSGNICRCTGYGRIVAAVQQVAVERKSAQ